MTYRLRDTIRWKFIRRNIIDFAESFFPITQPPLHSTEGKRILIFNWRDTKHKFAGGAEVYIHELAKRWVEEGNVVTLFCGNDAASPRNEVVDGVHVVRRGGFYFVYIWAFLYYMLHFRGMYDVIIDSQNGIPFFTPLYAREPVYSLLFHVHQEVFRRSLIKPLASIASFLERKCMPVVYKGVPFLTISESTKKEIIKLNLGRKGITIIHPGVDLQKLVPGKKRSKPMVLYLGRLKYYKRVDVLLHAAKEVLEKNPEVEFVIAGDGEYKKNLKKIAKRLGIENRVDFRGKVSEEEKRILYSQAWIVVNPSMMEGWGITTIEANACGTVVLASDVPGLRDSVKNGYNGYLFQLANHQVLAEKISFLLTHHYSRRMMSKNALSWASRYDWSISANRCLATITGNKKPLQVSIAIPAFNEERSITQLLTAVLRQKEEGFVLKEILVASDGSTDRTVEKVKSIPDSRIKLLDDTRRIGKSGRITQLLQEIRSDVVVLLDADITISDDHLFSSLFKEVSVEQAGVVSVKATPLPAKNFFERCINHSVELQNAIREKWNDGDNYLSFRGCFLVVSKSLVKQIKLPDSLINNDAYIYFKAKEKGYLPTYLPSLSIGYRSPATLSDHQKQSSRFKYSAEELSNYFDKKMLEQYSVPKKTFLTTSALYFCKNPLLFLGYAFISVRVKLAKTRNLRSTWSIALSTKTIR